MKVFGSKSFFYKFCCKNTPKMLWIFSIQLEFNQKFFFLHDHYLVSSSRIFAQVFAAVVQLRFEATSLNGQVGKNVNVDPWRSLALMATPLVSYWAKFKMKWDRKILINSLLKIGHFLMERGIGLMIFLCSVDMCETYSFCPVRPSQKFVHTTPTF